MSRYAAKFGRKRTREKDKARRAVVEWDKTLMKSKAVQVRIRWGISKNVWSDWHIWKEVG